MKSMESLSDLDQVLLMLKDPLVRDLAWVIGQPHLIQLFARDDLDVECLVNVGKALDLIDLSSKKALEFALPYLLDLDQEPERLRQSLERSAQQHKRVRLGVYYEHLVYFWLAEILKVSPLVREKQIFGINANGVKITLGALDLVAGFTGELYEKLCDQVTPLASRLTVHMELASKFYLKVSTDQAHSPKGQLLTPRFYRFLGPNERDSLGGKTHRLYTHQLALSQRSETIEILATEGIKVDARCLWLKGRLFDHFSDMKQQHAQQSLWLRQSEIQQFFIYFEPDTQLLKVLLCEKPHWLAPPHNDRLRIAEKSTSEQLLESSQQAKGERGSTLWYVSTLDLSRRVWLMIVPNDWGRREVY